MGEQDRQNMTRRIGQEEILVRTGQGCHNRTARIVISGQDCRDITARVRLPGQDYQAEMQGQDC
jgi:head-tail adaptor